MDNNVDVNVNEVSRLTAGSVFKGDITSTNDIRIDGTVEGKINTKRRLVAGDKAVLNGDVVCRNMDFSGTMKQGTFVVLDTLSLKSGCSATGDFKFARLQVELDAKLNGSVHVLTDKEIAQYNGNQPKSEAALAEPAQNVSGHEVNKENK